MAGLKGFGFGLEEGMVVARLAGVCSKNNTSTSQDHVYMMKITGIYPK